jgi:hypothetical protein
LGKLLAFITTLAMRIRSLAIGSLRGYGHKTTTGTTTTPTTPTPPPTVFAPVDSTLPVISGALQKGQTLSVTTGAWLNSPTLPFTYQWLRGTTAISGATGSTYVLLAADVGSGISCTVTAANNAGTGSATSAAVGPIIDLAPVNTVAPVLSGASTVGQTLTVTNGTWTNTPISFSYAWKLNGSPISGAANQNTYVLTSGENGGNVTCTVTAANSGGSASATSNAIGPIGTSGAAPTNTAVPTLSGDPVVGQTLYTSNGTWSGTVTSYTYQWFKDGAAISGETSDHYLILDMDVGSVFLCKVTAYNVGAASSPASSAATSAVTAIDLTSAITAFTRTSTSGDNSSATGLTFSIAFGSNVYEGYVLRAQVFSDSGLGTQTQNIRHVLTHDDLQSGATINLLADGLTKLGPTDWLEVGVETTSPNAIFYSFTYGTAISPTDAVIATVWNSGDKNAAITLSAGNLDAATNTASYSMVRATHSKTSGKWYFEVKVINTGNVAHIGWANATASLSNQLGADTNSVAYYTSGSFFYNGSVPGSSGAWATNDIIQVCVDADAGKVWFGRNNTFVGSPSAGTGGISVAVGTFFPAFAARAGEVLAQFTSASQTYTPPSGFTAIG